MKYIFLIIKIILWNSNNYEFILNHPNFSNYKIFNGVKYNKYSVNSLGSRLNIIVKNKKNNIIEVYNIDLKKKNFKFDNKVLGIPNISELYLSIIYEEENNVEEENIKMYNYRLILKNNILILRKYNLSSLLFEKELIKTNIFSYFNAFKKKNYLIMFYEVDNNSFIYIFDFNYNIDHILINLNNNKINDVLLNEIDNRIIVIYTIQKELSTSIGINIYDLYNGTLIIKKIINKEFFTLNYKVSKIVDNNWFLGYTITKIKSYKSNKTNSIIEKFNIEYLQQVDSIFFESDTYNEILDLCFVEYGILILIKFKKNIKFKNNMVVNSNNFIKYETFLLNYNYKIITSLTLNILKNDAYPIKLNFIHEDKYLYNKIWVIYTNNYEENFKLGFINFYFNTNCNNNCEKCLNNKCILCKNNYKFDKYNQVCKKECNTNEYSKELPNNYFICNFCHISCKKCTNYNKDSCTICNTNFKMKALYFYDKNHLYYKNKENCLCNLFQENYQCVDSCSHTNPYILKISDNSFECLNNCPEYSSFNINLNYENELNLINNTSNYWDKFLKSTKPKNCIVPLTSIFIKNLNNKGIIVNNIKINNEIMMSFWINLTNKSKYLKVINSEGFKFFIDKLENKIFFDFKLDNNHKIHDNISYKFDYNKWYFINIMINKNKNKIYYSLNIGSINSFKFSYQIIYTNYIETENNIKEINKINLFSKFNAIIREIKIYNKFISNSYLLYNFIRKENNNNSLYKKYLIFYLELNNVESTIKYLELNNSINFNNKEIKFLVINKSFTNICDFTEKIICQTLKNLQITKKIPSADWFNYNLNNINFYNFDNTVVTNNNYIYKIREGDSLVLTQNNCKSFDWNNTFDIKTFNSVYKLIKEKDKNKKNWKFFKPGNYNLCFKSLNNNILLNISKIIITGFPEIINPINPITWKYNENKLKISVFNKGYFFIKDYIVINEDCSALNINFNSSSNFKLDETNNFEKIFIIDNFDENIYKFCYYFSYLKKNIYFEIPNYYWKIYKPDELSFKIKYPENLKTGTNNNITKNIWVKLEFNQIVGNNDWIVFLKKNTEGKLNCNEESQTITNLELIENHFNSLKLWEFSNENSKLDLSSEVNYYTLCFRPQIYKKDNKENILKKNLFHFISSKDYFEINKLKESISKILKIFPRYETEYLTPDELPTIKFSKGIYLDGSSSNKIFTYKILNIESCINDNNVCNITNNYQVIKNQTLEKLLKNKKQKDLIIDKYNNLKFNIKKNFNPGFYKFIIPSESLIDKNFYDKEKEIHYVLSNNDNIEINFIIDDIKVIESKEYIYDNMIYIKVKNLNYSVYHTTSNIQYLMEIENIYVELYLEKEIKKKDEKDEEKEEEEKDEEEKKEEEKKKKEEEKDCYFNITSNNYFKGIIHIISNDMIKIDISNIDKKCINGVLKSNFIFERAYKNIDGKIKFSKKINKYNIQLGKFKGRYKKCEIYENNKCIKCFNNFYNYENRCYEDCSSIDLKNFEKNCVKKCDIYHVLDEFNNCVKCKNNCIHCNTIYSNECLKCKFPYLKYNNDCIIYCPFGHTEVNGECIYNNEDNFNFMVYPFNNKPFIGQRIEINLGIIYEGESKLNIIYSINDVNNDIQDNLIKNRKNSTIAIIETDKLYKNKILKKYKIKIIIKTLEYEVTKIIPFELTIKKNKIRISKTLESINIYNKLNINDTLAIIPKNIDEKMNYTYFLTLSSKELRNEITSITPWVNFNWTTLFEKLGFNKTKEEEKGEKDEEGENNEKDEEEEKDVKENQIENYPTNYKNYLNHYLGEFFIPYLFNFKKEEELFILKKTHNYYKNYSTFDLTLNIIENNDIIQVNNIRLKFTSLFKIKKFNIWKNNITSLIKLNYTLNYYEMLTNSWISLKNYVSFKFKSSSRLISCDNKYQCNNSGECKINNSNNIIKKYCDCKIEYTGYNCEIKKQYISGNTELLRLSVLYLEELVIIDLISLMRKTNFLLGMEINYYILEKKFEKIFITYIDEIIKIDKILLNKMDRNNIKMILNVIHQILYYFYEGKIYSIFYNRKNDILYYENIIFKLYDKLWLIINKLIRNNYFSNLKINFSLFKLITINEKIFYLKNKIYKINKNTYIKLLINNKNNKYLLDITYAKAIIVVWNDFIFIKNKDNMLNNVFTLKIFDSYNNELLSKNGNLKLEIVKILNIGYNQFELKNNFSCVNKDKHFEDFSNTKCISNFLQNNKIICICNSISNHFGITNFKNPIGIKIPLINKGYVKYNLFDLKVDRFWYNSLTIIYFIIFFIIYIILIIIGKLELPILELRKFMINEYINIKLNKGIQLEKKKSVKLDKLDELKNENLKFVTTQDDCKKDEEIKLLEKDKNLILPNLNKNYFLKEGIDIESDLKNENNKEVENSELIKTFYNINENISKKNTSNNLMNKDDESNMSFESNKHDSSSIMILNKKRRKNRIFDKSQLDLSKVKFNLQEDMVNNMEDTSIKLNRNFYINNNSKSIDNKLLEKEKILKNLSLNQKENFIKNDKDLLPKDKKQKLDKLNRFKLEIQARSEFIKILPEKKLSRGFIKLLSENPIELLSVLKEIKEFENKHYLLWKFEIIKRFGIIKTFILSNVITILFTNFQSFLCPKLIKILVIIINYLMYQLITLIVIYNLDKKNYDFDINFFYFRSSFFDAIQITIIISSCIVGEFIINFITLISEWNLQMPADNNIFLKNKTKFDKNVKSKIYISFIIALILYILVFIGSLYIELNWGRVIFYKFIIISTLSFIFSNTLLDIIFLLILFILRIKTINNILGMLKIFKIPTNDCWLVIHKLEQDKSNIKDLKNNTKDVKNNNKSDNKEDNKDVKEDNKEIKGDNKEYNKGDIKDDIKIKKIS